MTLQKIIKIENTRRVFDLDIIKGAIRRFEVVIVRRRTEITREKLGRIRVYCQGIRQFIKVRRAIFI